MIWEDIDSYHRRTKVFGGWLVKAYEDVCTVGTGYTALGQTGYEWRVTMCFVPDFNHEWKLEETK